MDDISENLQWASYHYSDDTTREWHLAKKYIEKAAELIVVHNITEKQVNDLYNETKPLVSKLELKNTCLNLKYSMSKHRSTNVDS